MMMNLLALILIVFLSSCSSSSAQQLSPSFYESSCPRVFDIVRKSVKSSTKKDDRMAASLLRLHFHDCFVNGCDGSVLLDDTANFTGEKTAGPNSNSVRGFNVIDNIKTNLEDVCPGVVSCADILAIAAMQSVVISGGTKWDVNLGRNDSTTANLTAANTNIPGPNMNLTSLIKSFSNKNLSIIDLVVLSGAHTIGKAKCRTFRNHIYNDTNINRDFANDRKSICPIKTGDNDNNLAPLDLKTPHTFDNKYYQNLVEKKGLLHSDQELFNGDSSTDPLVIKFRNNPEYFMKEFTKSMIKMSNLLPLSGAPSEIRKDCRKVNG